MTGLTRIWEQFLAKMLHLIRDFGPFGLNPTNMTHYEHDFNPNPSITSHILK